MSWLATMIRPYAAGDLAPPPSGSHRVYRGGSFYGVSSYCRCAYRGRNWPGNRYVYLGFRAALR